MKFMIPLVGQVCRLTEAFTMDFEIEYDKKLFMVLSNLRSEADFLDWLQVNFPANYAVKTAVEHDHKAWRDSQQEGNPHAEITIPPGVIFKVTKLQVLESYYQKPFLGIYLAIPVGKRTRKFKLYLPIEQANQLEFEMLTEADWPK